MESGFQRIERIHKELAGESPKPVSSREKSTAHWRTPPGGLWPARCGEFMTLWADFREKGAKPIDPTRVFRALHQLLGDHSVTLFSARVRSGKAAIDAGWCTAQHGHTQKVKISELADPKRWKTICEPAGGFAGVHCRATRGGGKTQHTVWFLDLTSPDQPDDSPACERFWLAVAAQHISASTGPFCAEQAAADLAADINGLVGAFFEAACRTGTVVCGAGEVIKGDTRCYDAYAYVNGVRFGDDAINIAHGKGGPYYRYVAAYNLFGPALTRRLGGVKKLQRLVVDFDARALPGGGEIDWKFGRGSAMRARAFGSSSMVAVYPWNERLEQYVDAIEEDTPRDRWLKNELARAGMLEHQYTGWQEAFKQDVLERRRELLAEQRHDPKSSPPATSREIDWTTYLSHMRENPPRLIRSGGVVDRLPWETLPTPNLVTHQLTPRSNGGAMPIYGRAIDAGIAALASPILVGSLESKRATCSFDERFDGHDVFMDSRDLSFSEIRHKPKLSQFRCAKCQGRLFRTWVQLEYPDDLDDFRNEPEYADRQELFTWFYLYAECVSCKWHGEVASIECG